MTRKAGRLAVSGPPSRTGAIRFVGALGEVDAVPWKNEGGQTRELCVEPPEADFASFVWRVSVADVGADADFSSFEGIDRTIVLLEGGGFTMHSAGRQVHDLAHCFVPHAFPGEQAVQVRLHGAPTLDFNLMVRREFAEGRVVVLDERNSRRLPGNSTLLYVAQGSACLSDEHGLQQSLRAGEFARLAPGDGAAMPDLLCAPGAIALLVCIVPR
ncbi:HutD family protein [Herbaspirillum sp. GW103]|uniref:HutD/Ves family protein n=1 Tax=Herbaspirillum sp. GW103 TaxID=1175306 RepID=UPI00067FA5A4|nr:HutD family protein [Herbaspirillum sp. GW103]